MYDGERSLKALKKFAKSLGPMCTADSLERCSKKKRAELQVNPATLSAFLAPPRHPSCHLCLTSSPPPHLLSFLSFTSGLHPALSRHSNREARGAACGDEEHARDHPAGETPPASSFASLQLGPCCGLQEHDALLEKLQAEFKASEERLKVRPPRFEL